MNLNHLFKRAPYCIVVCLVFWVRPMDAFGQSAQKMSVQCIKDDGSLQGGTNDSTCYSMVPKCSDVKNQIINNVKELISLKIYAYYLGVDADISQGSGALSSKALQGYNKATGSGGGASGAPTATPSGPYSLTAGGASGSGSGSGSGLVSLTAADFTGTKLSQPVCNVMGRKGIQLPSGTTSIADAEVLTQGIGNKGSCAPPPTVTVESQSVEHPKLKVTYPGPTSWASYLLGAYIWVIRKNAADVFKNLDLSNLDPQNEIGAAGADIAATYSQMAQTQSQLSSDQKKECLQDASQMKCDSNTGVTSAAQRICQFQKAASLLNGGVFANIVLFQIMKAAQKDFSSHWANLLQDGTGLVSNFVSNCGLLVPFDTASKLFRLTAKNCASQQERVAYTASCMLSTNTPGGNNWCTGGKSDGNVMTQAGGAFCAQINSRTRISSTTPGATLSIYADGSPSKSNGCHNLPASMSQSGQYRPSLGGLSNVDAYSVNYGVSGAIEAKIRSYCGQNVITDKDLNCASDPNDPNYIPDKPAFVQ